jgi:hypothetical protein
VTRQQAAWQKKPYVEEPHYLYANILQPEKRSKIRLRLNYSTLFCLFSIVAGIACLLYERFGK